MNCTQARSDLKDRVSLGRDVVQGESCKEDHDCEDSASRRKTRAALMCNIEMIIKILVILCPESELLQVSMLDED